MTARSASPHRGARAPGRPFLLLLTLLSWIVLAGVCGVQYLSGQSQLLSAKCQGAVLLQPQAAAGTAAAAQAASLASQLPAAAQAPAPDKQQAPESGGNQAPRQGAAQEQPPQEQQRAGGGGGNGTRSSSSSGSTSSARLPESWGDVDALIQAPTPRHGLQQKGGLPNRCARWQCCCAAEDASCCCRHRRCRCHRWLGSCCRRCIMQECLRSCLPQVAGAD